VNPRQELEHEYAGSPLGRGVTFEGWLVDEVGRLRVALAAAKAEPPRPASREPTKCPHCSRVSHYSLLRESYVCALCGPWQSKPT
jgi:hypothetical protein